MKTSALGIEPCVVLLSQYHFKLTIGPLTMYSEAKYFMYFGKWKHSSNQDSKIKRGDAPNYHSSKIKKRLYIIFDLRLIVFETLIGRSAIYRI